MFLPPSQVHVCLPEFPGVRGQTTLRQEVGMEMKDLLTSFHVSGAKDSQKGILGLSPTFALSGQRWISPVLSIC